MGCVAACKFHSTPPQKCNNNTLLYLRSHPLRVAFPPGFTAQSVEQFSRDLYLACGHAVASESETMS